MSDDQALNAWSSLVYLDKEFANQRAEIWFSIKTQDQHEMQNGGDNCHPSKGLDLDACFLRLLTKCTRELKNGPLSVQPPMPTLL
jgi:hypothetical protein